MNLFTGPKRKKLDTDSFTNLIAQHTVIRGAVSFSGVIQIAGMVDGDIINSISTDPKAEPNCINITSTGVVGSDNLEATNIVVSGQVTSKVIRAEDTLRVTAGGTIKHATIYYRYLEIEPGALLHDCQLKSLDHSSEGEQV